MSEWKIVQVNPRKKSRLSRFREEVSRFFNVSSDKTKPVTHTSVLQTDQKNDITNKQHRYDVAWRDPIAHRSTVMLATNTLDDWFYLKKLNVEEDDENDVHEINDAVQEEFKRLKAKYHLTQALMGERIHGQSAVVLNRNEWHQDDFEGEGYAVASLDVFDDMNSEIPDDYTINGIIYGNWDRYGRPKYLKVYYNDVDSSKFELVPFEDIIWFCTRPIGRSMYGHSAMESIWDDLTYMRGGKHNMGWLYQKMGLGWLALYNRSLTAEDADAQETMLENLSGTRAMALDVNRTEKVEWVGPRAGSHSGIVEGIDMFLGHISAGSGVPKDIYIGMSAGAITGSEINNKALYALISKIQSDIEDYIRELISRMGYDDEYEIEWNTRYATDELEQAQIRLLNAQAAQLESMAQMGMGPNDMQFKWNEPEKTQNDSGVQS